MWIALTRSVGANSAATAAARMMKTHGTDKADRHDGKVLLHRQVPIHAATAASRTVSTLDRFCPGSRRSGRVASNGDANTSAHTPHHATPAASAGAAVCDVGLAWTMPSATAAVVFIERCAAQGPRSLPRC